MADSCSETIRTPARFGPSAGTTSTARQSGPDDSSAAARGMGADIGEQRIDPLRVTGGCRGLRLRDQRDERGELLRRLPGAEAHPPEKD